MDLEIESLRRKLKNAHFALAQTQTQMELHRIRTRQIIMAWKIRIHEAEDKVSQISTGNICVAFEGFVLLPAGIALCNLMLCYLLRWST